jgi:hypothetical protein
MRNVAQFMSGKLRVSGKAEMSECIGNDILSHYVDSFFNLVHLFIARFSEAEVEKNRRARSSCRNAVVMQ